MGKSIFAGLLIVLLGLLHGCSKGPSATESGPSVAATIFPLCDIARNIAGDKLEIINILPPGSSPHTYSLTPRQVRRLEGVRVVFSVGYGLDDWTDTLLDTLPNLRKVVVDRGIDLMESAEAGKHEHAGGGHNRHEGANPHYWLSIENGKQIARNIAEEIIGLDAANEGYYRANLGAYLSKLDAAKARSEERISRLPRKDIMTFHNAWIYFAEEFGLEVVGAFEPFPGKQPTPRYLTDLHDKAQEYGLKALFSEPQLSSETVAAFVSDIGLKLYVLDPLGGVEGRDSYIGLFEYNTDIIVEALSDGR